MTDLDKISMMLISYSGAARSLSVNLIDAAEKGEPTQPIIEEIEENLKLAGQEHFKVLQLSATQEIEVSVLFLHSEDQMMAAETLFLLAKKFVAVYDKINEK